MEKESHGMNTEKSESDTNAAAENNEQNIPQPVPYVRHSSLQHPASVRQLCYGHINYGNYTHSYFLRG